MVMEKLQTTLEKGIDSSTIDARIDSYGSNKPPPIVTKGFCKLFFEALNDLTIIILFVAAVTSIVVNMIHEENKAFAWIEGFAILVAIVISAGV